MKTKPVFAVWSNTDLTEGRGTEYVIAFCELEATAKRLSKGAYVQGTDARITKEVFRRINNVLWAPHAFVVKPSDADVHEEKLIEMERELNAKRTTVLEKVKALGLTDDEIEVLRAMRP